MSANLASKKIEQFGQTRHIQEKSRRDAPGTGSDKQHPDTPPPPILPKPDQQKPEKK